MEIPELPIASIESTELEDMAEQADGIELSPEGFELEVGEQRINIMPGEDDVPFKVTYLSLDRRPDLLLSDDASEIKQLREETQSEIIMPPPKVSIEFVAEMVIVKRRKAIRTALRIQYPADSENPAINITIVNANPDIGLGKK